MAASGHILRRTQEQIRRRSSNKGLDNTASGLECIDNHADSLVEMFTKPTVTGANGRAWTSAHSCYYSPGVNELVVSVNTATHLDLTRCESISCLARDLEVKEHDHKVKAV